MRRPRRRADLEKLEAEIEAARPYLELAKEINDQVRRVGAEGAGADHLVEAIEAVPRRERAAIVRAVFDQLPPDQQWDIIERVYGDGEIREYLEAERERRRDDARRSSARAPLVTKARSEGRLDTRLVPDGEPVVLGLFVEQDAAAAIPRGHSSGACARRLLLRGRAEPGTFQVIEDVFNPAGGYFVTGRYDHETWRDHDRLPPHAVVRAGAVTQDGFEPVLYAGGRVDFDVNGDAREGRLHLGYLMVGGDDVFGERGGAS